MIVPAGTCCIFPVNIDGIQYATAQIVAKRDGKIYLEQIAGIPTEIAVDGKVLRNVRAKGLVSPIYRNIYLLTSAEAENLFLPEEEKYRVQSSIPVSFHKKQDAGLLRKITIGVAGVAEEPVDADFEQAAIYRIDVPSEKDCCPSNTRETVPVFTQMASCWLIISTMAVSFCMGYGACLRVSNSWNYVFCLCRPMNQSIFRARRIPHRAKRSLPVYCMTKNRKML